MPNYNLKKVHYVSATVIVVRDGKFLIVKRAPGDRVHPGKWTVPGGALEIGDYTKRKMDGASEWYNILENLARREVMEETGLHIKSIKYVTSLVFMRPEGIPTLVVSLSADYHSGKTELSSELTEHAWVTLDEAKKYDLIDGIYEELEMVNNRINGMDIQEWSRKL